MKKYILLLFLCISIGAYAQSGTEEVVYLKNGGIVRGDIIEQVPNEQIKIQTRDGNVFVYQFGEIEKITKENSLSKSKSSEEKLDSEKSPKTYFKKGFTGITELGMSMDGLTYQLFRLSKVRPVFAFNQVLASRTSQHFSIGMGLGLELGRRFKRSDSYYNNPLLIAVPVTLDMRIYFLKKRISPFFNLAPGYSFFVYNGDFGHTFLSNTSLGLEYKINQKVGVYINGGYRLTLLPKAIGDNNSSFNTSGNLLYHGGFLRFGINY